jgi:hypothetical protein
VVSMFAYRAPCGGIVAVLLLATLIGAPRPARADESARPDPAAVAGDEEEAAMPEPVAAGTGQDAMCAGLDALLAQDLAALERRKALQTRQSLHCPAPSPPAPARTQESAARP